MLTNPKQKQRFEKLPKVPTYNGSNDRSDTKDNCLKLSLQKRAILQAQKPEHVLIFHKTNRSAFYPNLWSIILTRFNLSFI